jgi:two-component system LytT family sensor kinase
LNREKKLNNPEGETKTLIALGNLQQQQKNSTKAMGYFTQAKSKADTLRNPQLQVQVNNSIAKIYREQKKPDKELEVRSSNIELSNSASKFEQADEQNMEIGKAYAASNQMNKAVPFFEKSVSKEKEELKVVEPPQLFGKSNDLESDAQIYKLLAEEYLKRGETQKALRYLKTFVRLQDSIKSIRKRELEAALKLSTEIGKNQQRIDLLEKERILSERSIQILKQDKELREEELFTMNIIIGSLCFLLLFMLVGAYYILKSSREKRRANQMLAIKSLQGQMNPHFIFNALNSVNHYVSQNDERAANKYLSDFSKLMRSVMDTSKHDLIVLSEELEILRLYLQLEHSRFKEKFEYSFTIDDDIDVSEFKVPPMIIQPYIENAIWHGLRYIDGKGLLNIYFSKNTNGLLVTITDNGIGRKKSLEIKTRNQKMQQSTGMENIANRIRIMNELFKTEIRAEVSDAFPKADNPGTKVNLFIPKTINEHA